MKNKLMTAKEYLHLFHGKKVEVTHDLTSRTIQFFDKEFGYEGDRTAADYYDGEEPEEN